MEQFTYLIINLLIFTVPFLLSVVYRKHHPLYQNWKALILSITTVAGFFIFWDVIATSRGHWGFNPSKHLGISIINLPLEEVLFFITTGFSMLLVYEAIKAKWPSQTQIDWQVWKIVAATVLICFGLIYRSQEYTLLVSSLAAMMLSYDFIKKPSCLCCNHYYIYLSTGFILFVIFNTMLTAIPVVMYGTHQITNVRIITIPIEDFIYNYLLLTSYVLAYEFFKDHAKSKQKN